LVVFDIAGEDNGDPRQYQVDLIDVDLVDVKKTEVVSVCVVKRKCEHVVLFQCRTVLFLSQGQKNRGKAKRERKKTEVWKNTHDTYMYHTYLVYMVHTTVMGNQIKQ
jgi:hypothetical protein